MKHTGNSSFENLALISVNGKQPKKRNKTRRFILRLLISFIAVSITIFSIVPPLMMKDVVNSHVDFNKVYKAEDFGLTSEKLTLNTSDGLAISAQEVYVKTPKAVVIFISGIQNPSVTAFFDHARLLKEHGYASILFDMRGHGESEGDEISLGFKEYLDTKAVVDYIKSNVKYQYVPIVVFGVSMGAATAINSIGEIKEIDALISTSAYSSWEDVFCDNMEAMGVPKILTAIQKPFVKLYTTFRYGVHSYVVSPKDEIKKLEKRPALIMHTKGDTQVPFKSFERIVKNAPSQVETWTREEDYHFFVKDSNFDKLKNDPEYSERIIGFLDKHFKK